MAQVTGVWLQTWGTWTEFLASSFLLWPAISDIWGVNLQMGILFLSVYLSNKLNVSGKMEFKVSLAFLKSCVQYTIVDYISHIY